MLGTVGNLKWYPNSASKAWSHTNSFVVVAATTYFASVDDKATTACFLLYHGIKLPLSWKK